MKRGYQTGFYAREPRVRDRASREKQAQKIVWALSTYAPGVMQRGVCLDVGCSSGVITAVLSSHCRFVVGIDYDPIGLQAISRVIRHSSLFVRGDAMNLPFPDNVAHVVICAQVYEHVPDANRLFDEIHRVLVPGGVVYFSGRNLLNPREPHYSLPFLHWLPRAVANTIVRLTGRGTFYYEHLCSPWRMRQMLWRFSIRDITLDALVQFHLPALRGACRLFARIPRWFWRLLWPVLPSYNWILTKPR